MEAEELLPVVLEIFRRIYELKEQAGPWFYYEVDRQEWTMPIYGHQN